MADPTPQPRRSARWLAVIWVFGTIAAVSVSVGAVRLAGAQVTVRHPSPLSVSEVADAVAVERASSELGSDGSSDDTPGVDDHGSSSDDSASGGSGSSGPGSSGSGSSGGSGSDDKGGSTPTSGSSGGGGSGDSGSGGSGSGGSGSGGSDDGGSSGPGGGHDGPAPTTVPASAVFSKSTAGGAVTVRCTGDSVAVVSVTPAAGWNVDLRNSGPQEVEVRFEAKDDEVRVKARCSASVVSWSS